MGLDLEIFTFGGFEVRLGGRPITGFRSRKVAALLAFLAAAPQPQRREELAELLWAERSQAQALSNLRVVLSDLRRQLGEAIEISRERVGLRRTGVWSDLAALAAGLGGPHPEAALDLYRGDFLQGFYVPDAGKFDAWLAVEREKHRQKVILALQDLIASRRQGDAAAAWARRLLELDPLNETAHLELVRRLALSGQRPEALARLAAYQSLIHAELGLEPTRPMAELAARLQSGQPLEEPGGPPGLAAPDFLEGQEGQSRAERAVFVGRQGELAELGTHLEQACAGRGRVVFISGEAGSGKSALLAEFARRAQAQFPELRVVPGSCPVFSGMGDPFLPFRAILGLLVGDVAEPLQAETLTRAQARQLWEGRETVLEAILQRGPDLIDSLVPARLLAGAAGGAGSVWQQLAGLAAQKSARAGPGLPPAAPAGLLEQYAAVLTAAARQPLLVLLDDLQWADPSSLSLLSHLARRIQASPILIAGAYRPEEAALPGSPLGNALAEFKRQSGDRQIDLDRRSPAETRAFSDALLDSRPNCLGPDFRERFARHSGGLALFAVELLNDLGQRGLLGRDEQGRWVEQGPLNWEILPAKVEAVLEMRSRQLGAGPGAVLKIASVVGEEFSAEIVARILDCPVLELVRQLTDLARNARLVREVGIRQAGGQRLSIYRFCHGLYQGYFYSQAGAAERAYLHERAAEVLEDLCSGQPEELAEASPRLAWHFQQAGRAEKALDYLLLAGSRAAQLGASEDAIRHFQQGIEQLPLLAEGERRRVKELALRLASCAPLQALKGYADPEVRFAYQRVRELSAQMGRRLDLLPALYFLRTTHATPAERQAAVDLAEEILNSPGAALDPGLTATAHWALGSELTYRGEFQPARSHLERAAADFDPGRDGWLVSYYGDDPGIAARARLAWVLWFLGLPGAARQAGTEALRLAEQSRNPLVYGFALGIAGVMFHQLAGEVEEARRWHAASRKFSEQARARLFSTAETISAGWIMAEAGELAEGIETMRQGLAAWRTSGAVMHLPFYLALFAGALLKAGRLEEGLAAAAEGLAAAGRNNEHFYDTELYRTRAELECRAGDRAAAQISFAAALQVARRQGPDHWNCAPPPARIFFWETGEKWTSLTA